MVHMQANPPKLAELSDEPVAFANLRIWAKENRGFIHPALRFVPTSDGSKVAAVKNIPPHAPVLSCPFSLAITPELSRGALRTWFERSAALDVTETWEEATSAWTERMWICSYIVAHWLAKDAGSLESSLELQHFPYLETLPPFRLLSTPLTFSDDEMELLKGTSLYGATMDRKNDLLDQHQRCLSVFQRHVPSMAHGFTLERYQTAAIYISSRAFPSILLSPSPSLTPSPTSPSHPILLPLLDSLNHERNTAVTWMVDHISRSDSPKSESLSEDPSSELAVSVVPGSEIKAGSEVLNNYGPKPNSELVLGYGFAIPDNPDDNIVLQLGGSPQKWEIGRQGRPGTSEALDGIFQEAFNRLLVAWKVDMKEELGQEWDENHEDEEFEVDMAYMRKDAALMLLDASRSRLETLSKAQERLDSSTTQPQVELSIRPQVLRMVTDYVHGDLAISGMVMEYFMARLDFARTELRDLGVDEGGDDGAE